MALFGIWLHRSRGKNVDYPEADAFLLGFGYVLLTVTYPLVIVSWYLFLTLY